MTERPSKNVLQWLRCARHWSPRPVTVAGVLVVLGIGTLIGLFLAGSNVSAPAVGFVGSVFGALVTLMVTRANQRTQIAASIWQERTRAHQEAFAHWQECFSHIHHEPKTRNDAIADAQMWWKANCLYLTEEAREEFPKALMQIEMHAGLLEEGRGKRDPELAERVKENWRQIQEVGRTITRGSGGQVSDEALKAISPEPSPTKA